MSTTWYVRRATQVKGPFAEPVVRRLVANGGIQDGDELSSDLARWAPLSHLRRRFASARASAELPPIGAVQRQAAPGRPRAPKRPRRPDAMRRFARRIIDRRRRAVARGLAGLAGLTVALCVVVIAALGMMHPRDDPGAQCDARPAPGVDWSNCRLEAIEAERSNLAGATLRNAWLRDAQLLGAKLSASDLSYAELIGAELAYADLRGARLLGANLQRANLAYAKLAGADLAYADLSGANLGSADLAGARLDHAIWVDGRSCAQGSLGGCRLTPEGGGTR